MLSVFKATLVAVAGLALASVAARAHVFARPESAAAGSSLDLAFTVGHGCAGAPTVALSIKIPPGVVVAEPRAKPGWMVTTRTGEAGDEVEWRGGPLASDQRDTFVLAVKLPDAPGQTLYFPTVQECQQGSRRWIEIPAAGQSRKDLQGPAPALAVTPKSP